MVTENAKNKTFSTDATLTYLGFEYQKLVALEICLNSKYGEIIYIECFGDVSTSDTTYEIKHKFAKGNMPDRSPDFWKTLRNFVREKNNISSFSRLVLYTTAKINDTSIFFEWNQESPEVKLSLLESIYREPSETIREYCDLIFNFNDLYHRSDLLDILKRLEIRSSQKTIEEKYQDLKAHSSLIFVDEIFRDDLLKHLYAYISIKAIDNSYQWKVVYDDFIKDVQRYVRRYQQNEIPYPDLPADVGYTGNETFLFITELKAIELENEIESAVIDYIRAQKNSFKLLELGGESVRVSIDNFESELKIK